MTFDLWPDGTHPEPVKPADQLPAAASCFLPLTFALWSGVALASCRSPVSHWASRCRRKQP